MKEKEIFVPTDINEYQKSNILIGAKYRSTLLENKILAMSLAMSDQFETGEADDSPIKHRIAVAELRKMLGANKGSFYTQLNQAAASMTGKTIGMTSEDDKTFDYIAVVTRATCKDGVFSIEYNGALRKIMYQIKKNYSLLNLETMLKFKSNYAFRVYELLKSRCYHKKGSLNTGNVFNIHISLSELKLDLGVVNSELDSVKRVLNKQKHPDYDKAVEASPEKMFDSWSDFRRKVLEKAIKEINALSDLNVKYSTTKQGKGGKVHFVDFVVTVGKPNPDVVSTVSLSENDKTEILLEIVRVLGEDFTIADAKNIVKAADYNKQKVLDAYKVYKTASNVTNPTGWMISAIKNGYETHPPKKQHNFEEREYDFDELSRRFARN